MRSLRPSHGRGFTLIEMIMAIVVAGVVVAISANMVGKGFLSFFLAREVAENDWQGRLAIERMTRDIRAARLPADIATMTSSQLVFTDSDNDTITYTLSGTTLTRTQNAGTAQVLADNVTALTLSYLQDNGQTTAATAANVYYITVQLTVSSSNASTSYRSTVKPTSF